jgi:deoxycytidylate deaminase
MNDKWKQRFMALAEHTAAWSKEEAKVGAVMVDASRCCRGLGFNGAPPGYDDSLVTPENSTFVVVHAEVNALINSTGKDLTMFVTRAPCLACAGAIAASSIVSKVVCPVPLGSGRWSESTQQAIKYLKDRGIIVEHP